MDTDFHNIVKDNMIINSPRNIYIGKNVWIGCRSTILKGSNIPDGSIIAAGTVVSGCLRTSNAIYGGYPVKILNEEITWHY